MNKEKHKALMTMLHKQGVDEETRHDLVSAFTDGRTESTTGLTDKEMTDLINKMKIDYSFANNLRGAADAMQLMNIKKRRATVLAIAQRVGIHGGTDFKKFNEWMLKSSVHHKQLNKYTYDELHELEIQFRGIEANYKASAEISGTKAWHHKNGVPIPTNN